MPLGWKYTKLSIAALCLPLAMLMFATIAHAQETIKIGYLMQVHDAANLAIEKELGAKYKL
jgi:hypothetical protein